MYPILAVLALGLAIALERLIYIINMSLIDQSDETTQSWIERLNRTLGNG